MKKLFLRYQEKVLVVLSVVFVAIVVLYYILSIPFLADAVNTALRLSPPSDQATSFDIEAAKKLDLRGLTP